MYVYNISGLSSCVKDNKSDWVWYLGKLKTLGLQYMLLLLRLYIFFWKSKKRDFLHFLLCFTRFLELWQTLEINSLQHTPVPRQGCKHARSGSRSEYGTLWSKQAPQGSKFGLWSQCWDVMKQVSARILIMWLWRDFSSVFTCFQGIQSSSNSSTFPGISHRGINSYQTTRGIQSGLPIVLSKYCGTIGSPSCACKLMFMLCLFCDYRNCGSTSQANHSFMLFPNFPDFSLTNVKFPDCFRFSRWVATQWWKHSTSVLQQHQQMSIIRHRYITIHYS